jgi:hypothetical protein
MRHLLSAARFRIAARTPNRPALLRLWAPTGELFALRVDDVEPNLLRIDEAVKETERGSGRIGETKTESSNAYVSI